MKLLYKIYSLVDMLFLSIRHVQYGKCPLVRLPLYIKGNSIKLGDNIFIGKGGKLYCFGSGSITIGNNFCAQTNLMVSSLDRIIIGNNVLFGSNVMINDNDHVVKPLIGPCGTVSAPIVIGDNTWIGQNVCILRGVHIGCGCVIGAGSIVTKNVPDYSMVVGNPAKIIKKYDFGSNEWISIK